eukprot:1757818-Rhodomonas_salina.2
MAWSLPGALRGCGGEIWMKQKGKKDVNPWQQQEPRAGGRGRVVSRNQVPGYSGSLTATVTRTWPGAGPARGSVGPEALRKRR